MKKTIVLVLISLVGLVGCGGLSTVRQEPLIGAFVQEGNPLRGTSSLTYVTLFGLKNENLLIWASFDCQGRRECEGETPGTIHIYDPVTGIVASMTVRTWVSVDNSGSDSVSGDLRFVLTDLAPIGIMLRIATNDAVRSYLSFLAANMQNVTAYRNGARDPGNQSGVCKLNDVFLHAPGVLDLGLSKNGVNNDCLAGLKAVKKFLTEGKWSDGVMEPWLVRKIDLGDRGWPYIGIMYREWPFVNKALQRKLATVLPVVFDETAGEHNCLRLKRATSPNDFIKALIRLRLPEVQAKLKD